MFGWVSNELVCRVFIAKLRVCKALILCAQNNRNRRHETSSNKMSQKKCHPSCFQFVDNSSSFDGSKIDKVQ